MKTLDVPEGDASRTALIYTISGAAKFEAMITIITISLCFTMEGLYDKAVC